MGFNACPPPPPYFAKVRGQNSVLNKCSVDWEFCMPSSNRLVSSWIHSKIWLKRCILPLINFFPFSIKDDKILTQFVIHYKSRCHHNAVWNTMYYKLRCNSTQFVIYYKLRNYYKLQRNKGANALLRSHSQQFTCSTFPLESLNRF